MEYYLGYFISLITYTLTVEPTMTFDCGEYIATAANCR
jgi:hypothetical protein